MKPTLPHDVCRCLGLDCDVAETCLRYLCRQDVWPGTPFMEGYRRRCLYYMPENEDGNGPVDAHKSTRSEESPFATSNR